VIAQYEEFSEAILRKAARKGNLSENTDANDLKEIS
jgi:hypothetical protein